MMPTMRTSTQPRSLIATVAVAASCLAALVAAPSALALGFAAPPAGLSAQPENLQAGANSDLDIHIGFTDAADDVENLRISLPPGVVGNPNAVPQCTVAELEGPGCPAETQVGTAATGVVLLGLLPLTVTGGLYNLSPQPGEPARFGIRLNALPLPLPSNPVLPPIVMQSGVELRQSDYGLDTVINGIPNTATVLGLPTPIDVTSMDISLMGQIGDGAFLRNPTSCQPARVTFTADSYSGATADTPVTAQADEFTPTGCDQLDFSPEFSGIVGAPGFTAPGTKIPVSTTISQEATEAGLKRATVYLPSIVGSVFGAFGTTCTEAQFQNGTCSGAAVAGTAMATSPLLSEPLTGPVVLVENPAGVGLPRIGLDLSGQLVLKLKGDLVFDAGPGIAFDNLPDIPISTFQLRFRENGLTQADYDLCTTPATFNTSFLSHSGATAGGPSTAAVDGCGPAADKGSTAGKKCKKAKKKRKKAGKSDAVAAKKKKAKKRCKKKRKRKKR